MTAEERDNLRAETAMRILAAMLSGVSPPMHSEGPEAKKSHYRRAVARAEFAVTEANALIAELEIHEQAEKELLEYGGPIDPRSKTPQCAHGFLFTETCPVCEANKPPGPESN